MNVTADKVLTAKDTDAPRHAAPGNVRGTVSFSVTVALLVGSAVAMLWPDQSQVMVGSLGIVMMIVMLFMRFSAAICMVVPALIAMYAMRGWRLVESSMSTVPYDSIASWTLSVLPMFVLMGLLMWRSGMTDSAYQAGKHWLSWMPGGLAVGTNLAGTGLAAVSGSTAGVVYALGRVGLPEMIKAGYGKRLAVGSIIVASLPGQLIPPSILMVLYAGIAEVQVGQQLLAGVLPGLLVGFCFSLMLIGLAVFDRSMAADPAYLASRQPSTWKTRWSSLLRTWPVIVLALVIILGMFSGIVTATEAGALAAFGAFVLTFVWRGGSDSPVAAIKKASVGAVTNVGGIFFLLVGVELLSRMMTLTGISGQLTDTIVRFDLSRVEFLLVMTVVYIVLGAFMESLPMMVLTVPILIPTLAHLDISLMWFGVFVVFMGEIAVLSPPVGILAMIIHSIAKDPEVNQGTRITLRDIFVTSLWFLPMAVIVVAILIAWPEIVTWLPDLSG